MVDEQLNQAKDVLQQLQLRAAHPEETRSTDKRRRRMTDEGREYRKEILDKKRVKLVSMIIIKSSEIEVLL